MRILVLEDQPDKLRQIYLSLTSVEGLSVENLEECRDVGEAKRRLSEKRYNLLIIDISVPDSPDLEARADGGIRLLEEIAESDIYLVPDHIIGLTAYENLRVSAREAFESHGWLVLQYNSGSSEWIGQMKRKAEHILSALRSAGEASSVYMSELAIVCALNDPELSSIKRLDWNWQRTDQKGDHSVYYRGNYVNHDNKECVAHCGAGSRMGMAAAAIVATKMVVRFRPRYLCIIGIAAGVRGKVELGDIIAVDHTFDYGSGKWAASAGTPKFLIEPHHIQLAAELRSKFRSMSEDRDLWSKVKDRWQGDVPRSDLRFHLGSLASGAAVVADGEIVNEILLQDRKLLGVDMETYGVFAASEEAASPRPLVFGIKSACDFADQVKDDRFQRYAAFVAAAALERFACDYL